MREREGGRGGHQLREAGGDGAVAVERCHVRREGRAIMCPIP